MPKLDAVALSIVTGKGPVGVTLAAGAHAAKQTPNAIFTFLFGRFYYYLYFK